MTQAAALESTGHAPSILDLLSVCPRGTRSNLVLPALAQRQGSCQAAVNRLSRKDKVLVPFTHLSRVTFVDISLS